MKLDLINLICYGIKRSIVQLLTMILMPNIEDGGLIDISFLLNARKQ